MKIVVDANIFVFALLKDSVTRRLLKHPAFEFYTVDFVRSSSRKIWTNCAREAAYQEKN